MRPDRKLENFIKSTFRSVWALEVLCHLRAGSPESFRQMELVEGMRASRLVIEQSVDCLQAADLIKVDANGAVRYAPANGDLDALAAAAEALYARSPDLVRRLIVSAASPGITAFADAFKLKKD